MQRLVWTFERTVCCEYFDVWPSGFGVVLAMDHPGFGPVDVFPAFFNERISRSTIVERNLWVELLS